MPDKTYRQFCGLARALDHVGDRWTLLIVRELLIRPKRFGELIEALRGIASNLLTERLRSLEADGLVARRTLEAPAIGTVYELTDVGRDLEPAVLELVRFGRHYMDAPTQDDAFRPEWLALALRALLAKSMDGREGSIRIDVETGSFTIEVADGVVSVRLGAVPEPDCSIKGDAEIVLAVAAGAQTLARAVRERQLKVRGDRALFESLLTLQPA